MRGAHACWIALSLVCLYAAEQRRCRRGAVRYLRVDVVRLKTRIRTGALLRLDPLYKIRLSFIFTAPRVTENESKIVSGNIKAASPDGDFIFSHAMYHRRRGFSQIYMDLSS